MTGTGPEPELSGGADPRPAPAQPAGSYEAYPHAAGEPAQPVQWEQPPEDGGDPHSAPPIRRSRGSGLNLTRGPRTSPRSLTRRPRLFQARGPKHTLTGAVVTVVFGVLTAMALYDTRAGATEALLWVWVLGLCTVGALVITVRSARK